MSRRLPAPPAHTCVLRALTRLPVGFVTATVLALTAIAVWGGVWFAADAALVGVVAAFAVLTRRRPATGFVPLVPAWVTATASPMLLESGPSRLVIATAALPTVVVLAALMRRFPRRVVGPSGPSR